MLAVTDDLLFGSRLQAELAAAGHDVRLSGKPDREADVLIADLTAEPVRRIAALQALGTDRPPTLAFYSHIETAVRKQAEQAGLELVVPRSRIAREATELLRRVAPQ